MNYLFPMQLLILLKLVPDIFAWKYFTSLKDLTLTGSPPDPEVMHSEYTFGNCKKDGTIFYTHIHRNHMDILGKLIVRGWIRVPRIPTCIVLRAMSYDTDMFRSTAYAFQMCVPRITYCHSQKRFKYYYYEWYIPVDMVGGMNWDIYFFGPADLTWQ